MELPATERADAEQLGDKDSYAKLQKPLADGRSIQAEIGLDLEASSRRVCVTSRLTKTCDPWRR